MGNDFELFMYLNKIRQIFEFTSEQKQIVEGVEIGFDNTIISSVAGSGKTTQICNYINKILNWLHSN